MSQAQQHPLLLEIEEQARVDGLAIVPHEVGRLLSVLVVAMQANRVLEIGTAYGYATLWMALAQPPAGRAWTIDPRTERTDVARGYFRRAHLDDRIEVLNTPALESLRTFPQRSNLDIALVDADRHDYQAYLDAVVPLLKLSGLVVFSGCHDDRPEMHAFNEYFLAHPDLEATILPIGNGTGIGARKR